jgi:hypothetical protein
MTHGGILSLVAFMAWSEMAPATAPEQSHPEPRVIVDVLKVRGPHARADIQREARQQLWGQIIRCYRPGQAKKPKLRGDATFSLRAGADGSVSNVRTIGATLADEDVVDCWASLLRDLPLPTASGASDVVMQIYAAPGDR